MGNQDKLTRYVAYKGRIRLLSEWARQLGIDYDVLWNRLYRHKWPAHKAFETPVKHIQGGSSKPRFFTYEGKTQRMEDWARELGIPSKTLHARIVRSGWSIEDAFNTPVGRPSHRRPVYAVFRRKPKGIALAIYNNEAAARAHADTVPGCFYQAYNVKGKYSLE